MGFLAGDANLYRYVGNNPTNATDPSGLSAVIREQPGFLGFGKTPAEKVTVENAAMRFAGHKGFPNEEQLKELTTNVPVSRKQFETMVWLALKSVIDSPVPREYDSWTQLLNHAKYRAWVQLFALQLAAMKHTFPLKKNDPHASIEKSTCWEAGMIPQSRRGGGGELKGLVLKKDVTPAAGIKEFFAPGTTAAFDCSTFQNIVSRRALLEILDDQKYNEKYAAIGVAGLHIDKDPFEYFAVDDRLGTPGTAQKYVLPNEIGSAYDNENTVFVYFEMQLRLVAHPFGLVTPKQLRDAIKEKTGQTPEPAEITDISHTLLPR